MLSNLTEKDFPNCYAGFRYAEDVLLGEIDVCKSTYKTVQRFFKDIKRTDEFYFDLIRAERFLRVGQKFEHAKGNKWKSKNITFEPWQKFYLMCMVGFYLKINNHPRFRTAYISVPRGQGKSPIASITGLYFLSLDGESGADIICASTKKDAARIVFDDSRTMALKNPQFTNKTGTKVLAHTIVHPMSHSVMRPISSDSKSLDGLNPSLIIGDEVHEWTRPLFEVLDSSISKRPNSLFMMITTAGFNTEGIGHELFSYGQKVVEGHVEDDTFFFIHYGIDENDDWTDPRVWKKANPNWGISVDPINFEAKAKKAQETPASVAGFKVKNLNQWQNTSSPFLNMLYWDRCKANIKLEDYKGKPCYIALDLASKIDLVSISYIFKIPVSDSMGKIVEEYHCFEKSFLPAARLDDSRNAVFKRWAEEGYLHTMPGEVIDFEKIQKIVIEDCKLFRVIGVHVDPWSANETLQKLIKERINALEFRIVVANLSEPMKQLDALTRDNKLRHNGSPLFRWCAQNLVARLDVNENVFPRKSAERLKIDPIVATIMALAGHINDKNSTSVYETRGIRSV